MSSKVSSSVVEEFLAELSSDLVDVLLEDLGEDGQQLFARFAAEATRDHCLLILLPMKGDDRFFDVGLYLGKRPSDTNAVLELDFARLEGVVDQVKIWCSEFASKR